MRNTLVRFSIFLVPLAFVGGMVAVACSDDSAVSAFRSGESSELPPSGSGESTSFSASDGTAGDKAQANGSPLCGIVPDQGQCLPDDDGVMTLAEGVATCAENPDASVASDDAEAPVDGCRIERQDGGSYAPECKKKNSDRSGVDGIECSKGADCAPGFDCVDGEKGSVCRRYCCSGTCENQTSLNGGPTFCDIQKLIDFSDHKVPVCMPVKTCKLLRQGECSDNETCAVVNERGHTGCVSRGNAKAGESCEAEHCTSDLTCLGSPGDRRCYKLCRVDGTDCGPDETCTTGSVFQDTTFGVCKVD